MPGTTVGVYAGEATAGTEVSSTYEGRHITLLETELIHPFRASGFVNKGDPVIICNAAVVAQRGNAVGVALSTATALTDYIAVDTEGIWNLTVFSYDDTGAGSAIVAGDPLYIHDGSTAGVGATGTGDATISKRRNLVTQIPFGYALGAMVATGTGQVAVKVHWDPRQPMDEYALLVGAATDNGMGIIVGDAIAGAGVLGRGLFIDYDNNGIKTGAQAESNGLGINMDADTNVQSLYGINVYTAGLTGATINRVAAYTCYMDEVAGTVTGASCIHLETAVQAATIHDYISMRSHALQQGMLTCRSGGDVATYFLVFDPAVVAPCEAFAAAGNGDYSIKCYINGEITYLHTYDAP